VDFGVLEVETVAVEKDERSSGDSGVGLASLRERRVIE